MKLRVPDLNEITATPAGAAIGKALGLSPAARLVRGRERVPGPVVSASIGGGSLVADTLALVGVTPVAALLDTAESLPSYAERPAAVLVDATGLSAVDHLEELRQVLRPAVRGIAASGRVVIVGRFPASVDDVAAAAAQQALDGIVRTAAKELRGGATANLLWTTSETTAGSLASSLGFLLDGRSAYVDGQAWTVTGADVAPSDGVRPLDGRIIVVTGAARGIGAAIAETLARDGARLVLVDVPAAGEALAKVANRLHGTALQLDITTPDAGARLAAHVAQIGGPQARLYGIVHNAGITRDKMLANLDSKRWAAVLAVNLAAQLRINEALLAPELPGGLTDGGRIVSVSSTSGIAGNKGQTNYAASKAGVIGLVRALAPEVADRGITVNAVAPGFIATEMTAAIPYVQRQVFQRLNSLQQAGEPVDVAEAIGYLLDPGSAAVTGQVLRVCGQNVVGA